MMGQTDVVRYSQIAKPVVNPVSLSNGKNSLGLSIISGDIEVTDRLDVGDTSVIDVCAHFHLPG
jgi:hypothetical protein